MMIIFSNKMKFIGYYLDINKIENWIDINKMWNEKL